MPSGPRKIQHSVKYVVHEEREYNTFSSHSRPQFPRFTQGTPGTMTPPFGDHERLALEDSGFPTEARVKSVLLTKDRLLQSLEEFAIMDFHG